MLDRIHDIPGRELDLIEYSDAYDQAYKGIIFWKLEVDRRSASRAYQAGKRSRRVIGAGLWS